MEIKTIGSRSNGVASFDGVYFRGLAKYSGNVFLGEVVPLVI